MLEDYAVPACELMRHEHFHDFLHVLLEGKTLKFTANAGTTFLLPRGTIDELRWRGPTHRIAAVLHPRLLPNALDETAHEKDVELIEHWNLTDPVTSIPGKALFHLRFRKLPKALA